ncbi:MAG TPA: terminase family protein [Candidatus Saccharimonadales bacterium]|nr:terminase family protein [Candidatus Saccharimonadales bacterium]
MSRLGRHLAGGLDPVKLARNIGMEPPDPWQIRVLRDPAPRELLVIHRQGGKSVTASVAAVHAALFDPGALVLVVSPSQRQSAELFRTMLTLYRGLGRPVSAEAENALSVFLENGSRIVALPSDPVTVRGFSSVKLLIVDEAAFVDDEMMAAVRPMLAVSHGRLLVMGTPYGRRGWFYEASQSREFRVTKVTAAECPRITPEFLAAERIALGEWKYQQEYECIFGDVQGRLFASADLEAMFNARWLPEGATATSLDGSPPLLRIAAKPSTEKPAKRCTSFDGRHAFNDGQCMWLCGAEQPRITAGGAA